MPSPYTFTLYKNAKGFDYNGTHYKPGDTSPKLDACQMKGFIATFHAANPKGGIDATQEQMNSLEEECPATPNEAVPQQAPSTPPLEANPATTGGDSATQQGAPTPPVSGNVGGTPTDDGTNPLAAPGEEPRRPEDGEPDATHGGEQPQEQTTGGDPVDIFNGTFYLQETDLEIPNTILPLSFVRLYRSGVAAYGPFGWNWDHNYNLYVRELSSGDIALWRSLHEDIFKFDGLDFEPPRGVFEKMERVPGVPQAFEITTEGGTVMHFERPAGWIDGERIPLSSVRDRHGNKLVFSYGSQDKLAEVRDDDDRFFSFDYDHCGLLVAVSDQAGRKYEYSHDEQTMHLVYVKSPATSDHPDGIERVYHYEEPFALPELRHNIISVEDSKGNVYVENKYEQDPSSESYAKITEQLYGGYLFQFKYTRLQWVPANSVYINIPAMRVEVLNPDFGLECYTFNYRGDLLDRRYRLNKDKSFRIVIWQYEFDEQGNPSITTRPDGSQEINIFDFNNSDPRMRGKLLQKELTSAAGFPSPSRIVWKAKYEPVYQLLKQEENENGAISKYRYDFDVNPGAMNNSGKLKEVVHPDVTLPNGTMQSSVTKYEANNKGQIEAILLPNGVRHEMVYGTAGFEQSRLVNEIMDAGGLHIENKIKYGAFGYDTERIDGNGNSTKRVVNALGLPEKIVLPPINGVHAEKRLHYDTDKKIIASERPKGEFTDAMLVGGHIHDEFEREVLGYITKYHLSSNTGEKRTVRICPDFRGLAVETFNPDGSKIRRVFDERGLSVNEEAIGADGNKLVSKRVYDRFGKLTQETDTFGLTTKYQYDGFSRISKITLPNGTEIVRKWLKGDLLESEEITGDDGSGNIRQLARKTYKYDERGRKISESLKSFEDNPATAIDVTTTFYYDSSDNIEKIVNNRGGTRSFLYDGLGRLVAETDAMGNEEHFIYDNAGNLIRQDSHHKEPDGSVSVLKKTFAYDARNRRTETIEPDGAKFIEKYDDRDLVVRRTDYLGVTKETKYDSFNNRIGETQDLGGLAISHQWTLDNMSRMTSYIDPTGQITKYYPDSLGRVYKSEYPNGFSVTRSFNSAGQIREEVLGSGVKFEYDYDASNRLSRIKNVGVPGSINQVQVHEFVYDGLNRLVSAKAGANEVVRKYDSTGRLLLEKTHGSELKCKYDDNAGIVEKIWPDGRTEKYSHDLNGILTRIEETVSGSLGTGATLVVSLKPSGSNYFGEAAYQGGLKVAEKYDERKRLVELKVSSPAGVDEKIKYRYDRTDRKRVEAILGQDPRISFLEFDNDNRLTMAKDGFTTVIPDALTQAEHDLALNAVKTASLGAAREEKFDYDPADARTKHRQTGIPDKNYSYFSGHRIKNDGTNNYNYHIDGTLQGDVQFTYEADALGRVVTIKLGVNDVCKIEYDALGRPSIINEVGKPPKSFNYLGGFVEQENENGIPSRQISVHPVTGMPIAYHSALGTHYTLFDGRYNLVGLTNTTGDLLEIFRYTSFGVPEIHSPSGTTLPASAFGIEPIFGGQKFLSSVGLYLSKRRLMNPSNGVFLSPDPQGYVDSSSLYAYAAQDPINNIDPNGEIIPFIVAAFVIGGALAGAGYSIWDASNHPEKYEGAAGIWRPLVNTFGGAAIGGVSVVAGEAVLAAGGVGIFATGAGATALTATETFVLYGTASAVAGGIGRYGFNNMFPEYIDPVSAETIATDFVIGGALPVVGSALREIGAPVINGAKQMFSRAVGGNWRAFGNTWRLLSNPRVQYNWRNLFWNPNAFRNVSRQYWRLSGGANGSALHHPWFQNQSRWIPQGLRNAGFNLLEIPGSLNTWMGGRLGRELAFRGIVTSILAGTGLGSYKATSGIMDWASSGGNNDQRESGTRVTEAERHPNETTGKK